MKKLRPYQQNCLNECLTHLNNEDDPVLLMASVGAGKSLILAEVIKAFESQNKKVLCVVSNAELVRSNAACFEGQGNYSSIFCSSLNSKCIEHNVIFATPQSVLSAIKNLHDLYKIKFDLIVVDEAHMINYKNDDNTFMRIIRHYQRYNPTLKLLGATGTNFRFKGDPIVGEDALFKKQVGNITTAWLIKEGYLTKPIFQVSKENAIDFSAVRMDNTGRFNPKDLKLTVDKNQRLTAKIMQNLVILMESEKRTGCFIFASTKAHCDECLAALPQGQAVVVTGSMPQKERTEVFEKARNGQIKYLININIISVGVDIPAFDTCLYVWPTESLVLLVQTLGRALRLFPGKDALILDCAGNIDRHKDWDDPILLDALKQTQHEEEAIFECYDCGTLNTIHARRCIGTLNGSRCSYYFEFKACPECETKNDITSRHCFSCKAELIDPNTKLSLSAFKNGLLKVLVNKLSYTIIGKDIHISYIVTHEPSKKEFEVFESYYISSKKSLNYFYGNFLKKHHGNPHKYYKHLDHKYYKHLDNSNVLKFALNECYWPCYLMIDSSKRNLEIKKKIFNPNSPE